MSPVGEPRGGAWRTSGGYRDYPDRIVTRLGFVRDARRVGLTLAEIRSVLALRDEGRAPCAHATGLIHEHLDGETGVWPS